LKHPNPDGDLFLLLRLAESHEARLGGIALSETQVKRAVSRATRGGPLAALVVLSWEEFLTQVR
jgi:hypothetical protein